MSVTPKMVIHGGVGSLEGDTEKRITIHETLILFLMESYPILCDYDAWTATVHCTRLLEDDPNFNAGTGSKLQKDGQVRMSASLMDGRKNSFSAVINIKNIRNPIEIAEKLSHEKHKVIAGDEANEYARKNGIKYFDPITPQSRREYEEKSAGQSGTVGVVALDKMGNIVAATSTGGMGYELSGRVSDSGTVAGNYATKKVGLSCTGIGEHIVNMGLAVRVASQVENGMPLNETVKNVLKEAAQFRYRLGLVAIDYLGNIEIGKTIDELFYAKHDSKSVTTFYSNSE